MGHAWYEIGRSLKKWLPDLDSNQDKLNQNQLCYRYTIGQNIDNIHQFLPKSSPEIKKNPKKCGKFRMKLDFHLNKK